MFTLALGRAYFRQRVTKCTAGRLPEYEAPPNLVGSKAEVSANVAWLLIGLRSEHEKVEHLNCYIVLFVIYPETYAHCADRGFCWATLVCRQ
jgi:hypothetical protein